MNLSIALRDKLPVKFTRPFEPGSTEGYVFDIGPRFFLMATFGDGLRFDGFQCLRPLDVRALSVPSPHYKVVEAVLRKRRQRIPRKPRVDLSSLEALLMTANKTFSLVTIYRENVNPEVCHIGRVVDACKQTVSLLEIGPDALWDEEATLYSLNEITRVDFGGDYEEGLSIVSRAKK